MSIYAWWPVFFPITKDSIIQNLFLKLRIFKTERSSSEIWDCQWHKTFCNTSFYCLDLVVFFFQVIKIRQCRGFTFTIFSFFLRPPMPLQLVEYLFRTLEYFLCFSYLNRKIKIHSKTIANENILFINVIVCY